MSAKTSSRMLSAERLAFPAVGMVLFNAAVPEAAAANMLETLCFPKRAAAADRAVAFLLAVSFFVSACRDDAKQSLQ